MSMCLYISLSFVFVYVIFLQFRVSLSHSCPIQPVYLSLMCMSIHVRPFVIFMRAISHHYVSVRRSVTPRPAYMSFCFFVSVCQYSCLSVTFICTMSSTYVCVSVFLRYMSVYHVHSYVSVRLSDTFMYTIHLFHTFLRLSVGLHVFVYVYFHVNILHVQLFVRLFVTFVRHPPIRVCVSSCPFV